MVISYSICRTHVTNVLLPAKKQTKLLGKPFLIDFYNLYRHSSAVRRAIPEVAESRIGRPEDLLQTYWMAERRLAGLKGHAFERNYNWRGLVALVIICEIKLFTKSLHITIPSFWASYSAHSAPDQPVCWQPQRSRCFKHNSIHEPATLFTNFACNLKDSLSRRRLCILVTPPIL